MIYNFTFEVKYKKIELECKEIFKNQKQQLTDLDDVIQQIYQEELMAVLGNVNTIDEIHNAIDFVWEIIKKQDKHNSSTLLNFVCIKHIHQSIYLSNVDEIDIHSPELLGTFTLLFNFHNFYLIHPKIIQQCFS